MSNSTTNSETNSFTEAKARDIMGKINDDLNTIALRGFDNLNKERWDNVREDLWFILRNQDLRRLEIQFRHSGGENAVEYVIKSDYTIYDNRESGGINYHNIPKDAEITIAVWRNDNPEVWKKLQKNWTLGATEVKGITTDKGAYSKDGFGAEIKLKGSWGK